MSDLYKALLNQDHAFQEILGGLKEGETPVGAFGLPGQVIPLCAETVRAALDRPVLIVTHDPVRAKKLAEDLSYYAEGGVYNLSARELFFFHRDAGSNDLLIERLRALHGMVTGRAKIVVTTLEAMAGIFLSPETMRAGIFTVERGDVVEIDALSEKLLRAGYTRVDFVEGMGQFSVRGGIVDIYGPEPYPYRIELFDVEADSIRRFDPNTQRSIENLERAEIFPVRDILPDAALSEEIADAMERDLASAKKLTRVSYDRAREKYLPYIEKLRSGETIFNTDLLLPYIPEEKRASISEYFFAPPVVMIDEPRRMDEISEKQAQALVETMTDLADAGELLETHLHIQLDYADVKEHLRSYDTVVFSNIVRSFPEYPLKRIANFRVKTVTSFGGRLRYFREEIRRYLDRNYTVVLLGGTEEKTERLRETLEEMDFPVTRKKDEFTAGIIQLDVGHVHGGFEFEEQRFVLLNSTEIFGDFQKRKRKKKKRRAFDPGTFQVGDYVVHEMHGIGRFLGTTNLEVQGVSRDYISLQYSGGDKLFLPMDQMSLVHPYIASDDAPPKINRLNTQTWKRTKAKAKRSVEEMAEDLIRLYAKRENVKGHAFREDTPWQKEFEDAFRYEETDGQLSAIAQIKEDMEEETPMDRLLCADVGYGKTEVALRAAFKAIMDGKQVAFLVPTTILAQQHYNTMRERFSDFPVDIALLSRFRSKKEQARDLEGLRIGSKDIVVGTHRILSKDVVFKNLGLLIIDEEQRFGVRHKEKLKLLKENVDTLTLTATPIPRTLQMSMAGIRDMSVIDEPPEERFPVQTYVVEYNDIMIREAILKEIERGGQVYFVYNRVQSMEKMLADLMDLVPEATFAMANGQMSERELEDTMLRFVEREVDVLLCSTIIETGMDVANANTMIVWEANRLGLSQLYQLRGRIGRSSRIAYAYFTYRRDASISEIAEKRLGAIREFTEFGSGYKIAMRDLEIRGSGNILGESQHGHMNAIGYDLYIKFLRQAVDKAKGKEDAEETETTLDVLIDAYIPKHYIRDEAQRMEMYRKIAMVTDEEEEADVIDELIDRFSDPPKPVLQLILLSKIRHKAAWLKVESVTQKKDEYIFQFVPGYELPLSLLNELTSVFGKRLVFSLSDPASIALTPAEDALAELERVLDMLKLHNSHTRKD